MEERFLPGEAADRDLALAAGHGLQRVPGWLAQRVEVKERKPCHVPSSGQKSHFAEIGH